MVDLDNHSNKGQIHLELPRSRIRMLEALEALERALVKPLVDLDRAHSNHSNSLVDLADLDKVHKGEDSDRLRTKEPVHLEALEADC